MNENIVTALDIGTSKIFGISALIKNTGIEIIGTDIQNLPEDVIKKGRVVDIEETTNTIFFVLKNLQTKIGENIDWVTIGIGGGHLKGENYTKSISIEPSGREINENDIQTLRREINNTLIAEKGLGKKILYTVSRQYKVDNLNITKKEPIGMHGNALEISVHSITVDTNPLQDIKNCIKNAGAQIESIYPHSWAAAEAVITEEEKKIGCLLLDIGKGTTDICFFTDGIIAATQSIKIGGGLIDSDISRLLHTPLTYAEEIKKTYGYACYPSLLREDKNNILSQQVEILNTSGKLSKNVTVGQISNIVYERLNELFSIYIKPIIMQTGEASIAGANIVITGGSAKIKDITTLSEEIFGLPSRIGAPKNLPGLETTYHQPEFSTGIGLVMLASQQVRKDKKKSSFQKVKKIFEKFF
ncbi:MAG: cell division protein FtsA [Candidatus Omnitrophica bacterium]|nr:cell division protein FtsA [Candidatus Omnitrophota bacterium]MCM8777544.1 cell division protein FtsA [Candidatus Omnitrophota bacterium]